MGAITYDVKYKLKFDDVGVIFRNPDKERISKKPPWGDIRANSVIILLVSHLFLT